jgi:hypothetical protein
MGSRQSGLKAMSEQTQETETEEETPPIRTKAYTVGIRIGRLQTLRDIAIECGKLYRRAARGKISSADASRQASILAVMRERRLEELETRLTEQQSNVVRIGIKRKPRGGGLPRLPAIDPLRGRGRSKNEVYGDHATRCWGQCSPKEKPRAGTRG